MERTNLAREITVVGSGASLGAGIVTAATSIGASAFSIALPPAALAIAGIAGLVLGGAGTYFLEDKIVHKAEEEAKHIQLGT